MCSRARRHLRGDVGQHDVGLHDAELAVVDRHDGTMAAQMTASAAGLGVADDPARAVAELQRRVAGERRQTGSIGHQECRRGKRLQLVRRGPSRDGSGAAGARERGHDARAQSRVKRRASNSPPSTSSTPSERSHCGVQRRVQPVGADARRSGSSPAQLDDRRGQPRRGVHRQMKRRPGRPTRCASAIELVLGEIDAARRRCPRGAARRPATPGRMAGGRVRRSRSEVHAQSRHSDHAVRCH